MAQVQRATKRPDVGGPGSLDDGGQLQTLTPPHHYSPSHPAGVILIAEDSHRKASLRGKRILLLSRCLVESLAVSTKGRPPCCALRLAGSGMRDCTTILIDMLPMSDYV